jgi:glycosyltransferase involved in cell wall biosynthesis
MPYKIGIVSHRFPPYLGGCELYSLKLAQGLTRLGHEVTVYTTQHPDRGNFDFRVREFVPVSLPGSGYIFWPAIFQREVFQELADYDVLHAISFSMFSTLAWLLAGHIYRRPLVLTTFYHPPEANPRPTLNALYDRLMGRLIRRGYDAFIVHSEMERQALEKHVGIIPKAKLHRIASGPILDGVTPDRSFRRRYGLQDAFIVLYVGRIDFHKGVNHLLQATATLPTTGLPPFRLALVGRVEDWYRLPRATESLLQALNERVVLTGPLLGTSLAAAYAESDVVVVPSRYESYGFTIVESLSYGTPVIATATGIAPELITDGYNGFLYPYGDVEGLAVKLQTAMQYARDMRLNARNSVQDLSWEKTLIETIKVYESVISKARSVINRLSVSH